MSLNWEHERDATIEFILCFVWGMLSSEASCCPASFFPSFHCANEVHTLGAFDIIAEFWPHVAIILYRVYPTNHNLLCKVFCFSSITTFAGTIVETITVTWLFGSLWHRWTLPFKIVTPILHVLFSAAQLFGAKNLRGMWLEQKKLRREQKHGEEHMAGIVMQVHANSGSDNQNSEAKDPPNPEGVAGASRL
jgi:hypothetical protein